jgi:hypothetical protein
MHHLFHHANCADGFAAACIARHALLLRGIPAEEITVTPVNYGWPNQIPDIKNKPGESIFVGDHIYYLDYTPPSADLVNLVNEVKTWDGTVRLTIIDHHEKAAPLHGFEQDEHGVWQRTSTPPFESVFKFTQSGAGLAWQYFHPAGTQPLAITLIEHRDLGHAFQQPDHPHTNDALALHAYLFRCLPRSFEAWAALLFPTSPLLPVLQIGARLRAADSCIIAAAVNAAHWLNFSHLSQSPSLPVSPSGLSRIPAVNGLDAGLISDACTALLKAYPSAPFAVSWYICPATGQAIYSLRSRKPGHPDGHINVSQIAATCAPKGGGHPCAAGFSTSTPIPFAA